MKQGSFCPKYFTRRHLFGFTLVELLVVITIIILLAGILYPVVMGAKKKASETACLSQLRQMSLALQMYTMDHEELYPMGGYELAPGTVLSIPTVDGVPVIPSTLSRVVWQDALLLGGYIRASSYLVCPSTPPQTNYRSSYGANRWVMAWGQAVSTQQIPDATSMVMVTEKTGADWAAWPPSDRNNAYYLPLEARHQGRLLVLFCDGHVRSVPMAHIEAPGCEWRW